ncbi:DUF5817 domain-containing protein [Halorarum halobium]|uniref:DUF5817 domain-containing protein n=1 Tax=Halorarum halobium TaxID=3075121 RepID=UPI0028B15620|nr:DUF5817 domain-containing protein [Halobaculum sp. XH14]
MYAVVGCTDCGAYWLLSDPDEQKSATCTRCGTVHRTKRLRRFFESEDRSAAVGARAQLLAEKRGDADAFDAVGTAADHERAVEDADRMVSDREYLEGSGLDADEVAAATEDSGSSGSRSRDQVVRDALREGNTTESSVVEYATEHGVPAAAARDLLERLTRRGEVSESRGEYRLL